MSDRSIKAILAERGLKPKKSFGQNFMVDQGVNQRFIASVMSFGGALPILEIGTGTGSLTSHLVALGVLVHSIERDRDLLPLLNEQFAQEIGEGRLVLHEADGARFDVAELFSAEKPGLMVGNLPYQLTSSIILLALKAHKILAGAVFLLQKEAADRLLATEQDKDYGFLSVVLNLAFDLKRVANIDRQAFWPVPKVDSSLLKLSVHDHGISRVKDLEQFIGFVRGIFQQRRKKMSTILSKILSKEQLASIGVDPDLRPENLRPAQFLELFLLKERVSP